MAGSLFLPQQKEEADAAVSLFLYTFLRAYFF
jgi:hypothetical protein